MHTTHSTHTLLRHTLHLSACVAGSCACRPATAANTERSTVRPNQQAREAKAGPAMRWQGRGTCAPSCPGSTAPSQAQLASRPRDDMRAIAFGTRRGPAVTPLAHQTTCEQAQNGDGQPQANSHTCGSAHHPLRPNTKPTTAKAEMKSTDRRDITATCQHTRSSLLCDAALKLCCMPSGRQRRRGQSK